MTEDPRQGTVAGVGGTRLHWKFWEATDRRATLLLLHGLGEHSGRYEHLARYLAKGGISVFSFDHRGHGLSQGPRGDVDAFSLYLEDLAVMEAEWERRAPGPTPRLLMGHSMGGLLALRRIQEGADPFRAAVLSAPWLATAVPAWVLAVGSLVARVFPGVPLPNGLSPERLTRDPRMQEARARDPLVHTRITGRLFRGVEEAQRKVLGMEGAFPIPALFLLPSEDPVVRTSVSEGFARGIVGKGVRVEILEGRRHEPLNDLGREEVVSTLAGWLQEQVGR